MAVGWDALFAGNAGGLVGVAAGHDDEPVARGERFRGVQADARGAAGDDHGGAGRGGGVW